MIQKLSFSNCDGEVVNATHAGWRGLSPMSMLRTFFRVLMPLSCFGGSICLLNLAAYHLWLSGGPPDPHPKWHLFWGNVFAALGLSSGLVGVLLLLLQRAPDKRKKGARCGAPR